MANLEIEDVNKLVTRVFAIEDYVLGDSRSGYLAKYHGRLLGEDVPAAYDQLAELLRPHAITPLFRVEDERQTVILLDGLVTPKPSSPVPNILLFILTVFSVMLSGVQLPAGQPVPEDALELVTLLAGNIFTGWPFAVGLLSILLAHEFGHYFAGRYHNTAVSLPYFLPFPLSLLGTLGAFINLKEPPKNKRVLLDIGLAGPLAGLVVAIPVLLIGLSLSSLGTVEAGQGGFIEGNSLLYLFAKFVVFGQLLPAPASYEGTLPILYWLQYFFTGDPVPYGGTDVFIHPVALAGWAGLLVTALNLIPAGQLDGGHIAYVLFGGKLRRALPVILVVLGALGFVWQGWWLWMLILLVLGRQHAEPLDTITELDPGRRALAWLGLVIFFLVISPVPFISL